MESLLCNEILLMSPNAGFNQHEDDGSNAKGHIADSFYPNKEDCEEAFGIFLNKEARYMPESGYLKLVESNSLIQNARLRAVNWLVKSQKQMNISCATVFGAVNYLDRFISLTRECQVWKHWTFELLSIACLSIASKFNETTIIPLPEYQVDESMDRSFSSKLIQEMELMVLKALGWRMDCTTPFSYVDLLIQTIDFNKITRVVAEDFTSRVTELLLNTLSDYKFLEFRPSVIAISAFKCLYEDLRTSTHVASLAYLESTIPQVQKDELIKCQNIVKELLARDFSSSMLTSRELWDASSSPVTVLKLEWYDFKSCRVDLSVMKTMNMDLRASLKRKREELE